MGVAGGSLPGGGGGVERVKNGDNWGAILEIV